MGKILDRNDERTLSYHLAALLTVAVFFIELFFNGKYLFCTPFVFLGYLFYYNPKFKGHISKYLIIFLIWLIFIFLQILILGMIRTGNEDFFSFYYNLVLFANITMIFFMIGLTRLVNYLLKYLDLVVQYGVLLCTPVIFLKEIDIIQSRWRDFLNAHSGYRLGVSSNINPNSIAWLYGFFAMLTLYFLLKSKKIRYVFLFVVELVCILFTGSKTGLLTAFIPVIFAFFKSLRKAKISNVIVILLVGFIFWYEVQNNPVLYTLIGKRLNSFLGLFGIGTVPVDAGSTLKRIHMIEFAENMIWEKPILGWGIGAFAQISGFGVYSHNNFIESLVSGGIVFSAAYYFIYVLLSLQLFSLPKCEEKEVAILLIVSNLLIDFSTVTFYGQLLPYFKIIIIAMLLYYIQFIKERVEK
ncbi:O-antigen ligase family protein [Streptococcus suis]|uniref:O-antigen ligase family protein n=1 Tax=Streptococcus suis TaxID=1307 RepID=UPI0038BAAEAC